MFRKIKLVNWGLLRCRLGKSVDKFLTGEFDQTGCVISKGYFLGSKYRHKHIIFHFIIFKILSNFFFCTSIPGIFVMIYYLDSDKWLNYISASDATK